MSTSPASVHNSGKRTLGEITKHSICICCATLQTPDHGSWMASYAST
jgi:hypothetical protein